MYYTVYDIFGSCNVLIQIQISQNCDELNLSSLLQVRSAMLR